jgi:hypothetical protein
MHWLPPRSADQGAVDELVTLHRGMFPGYRFVSDDIVEDAAAPPRRDSLIVLPSTTSTTETSSSAGKVHIAAALRGAHATFIGPSSRRTDDAQGT